MNELRQIVGTLDWLDGLQIVLVAAGMLGLLWARRQPALRERWDHALLRLPIVGRLVRSLDAARFASTLSILAGSGAPLLRSLEAAADVVRTIPMAAAARRASGTR